MPLFGRPWLCSSNKSTTSTSTAGSRSSKSSKRSLKQRKRHQQALKQFLKEELQAAPRHQAVLEDHSETFHMDQSDSTRHGEEDRQVRFHPSVDKEMERRRKYRLKNPPKIDPRRVQTRTRQQLDIAVEPTGTTTTSSASTSEVPSSQRDQLLLQHQDSFSLLEKAPAWGWGYVEELDDDDTACTAESSYASFFDDCLVFGSNAPPQQAEDTFVYLSPNMAEF